MYKTYASLLVTVTLLILATLPPIQEVNRNFEFTVSKTNINMNVMNFTTTLEIDYTADNHHYYDIASATLVLDTFLEGEFVKQVTLLVPLNVKHHQSLLGAHEFTYDNVYFDEIQIVSVNTLEKSFFTSYRLTITLGILYNFILVFMWMYVKFQRNYLRSELNFLLYDFWPYAVGIILIIPMLVNFLSLSPNFYRIFTLHGWIYWFTVVITFPIFYGAVWLYQTISER